MSNPSEPSTHAKVPQSRISELKSAPDKCTPEEAAQLSIQLLEEGMFQDFLLFSGIAVDGSSELKSQRQRALLKQVLESRIKYRMNQGDLSSAEASVDKAFEIAGVIQDMDFTCILHNLRGALLGREGRRKEALLAYREGLDLARELGNDILAARFLYNSAVLFMGYTSLRDMMISYNSRAERIYRDTGSDRGLAYSLSLSSMIWEDTDREKALCYGRESLEIRGRLGKNYEYAFTLLKVARLLDYGRDWEEALSMLGEGRSILKREGYMVVDASTAMETARVYLAKGELEKAEALVQEAAAVVQNIEGHDETKESLLRVSGDLARTQGRWKDALALAEELEGLREARYRKEKAEEIKAVCAAWDADAIEKENLILSDNNREMNRINRELEEALGRLQSLSGLLPVCPECGRVRDDKGYWLKLEDFFVRNSAVLFSHSLCEDCRGKLYGGSSEGGEA